MDFTAVKGTSGEDNIISVTNSTDGLCAVRLTKMSDGSVQYKSNIFGGRPVNKTTAFTFNISTSEYYMVEAWHYDGTTNKLIPTAVKYV